jgi:hypothetical protein
MFRLQSTINLSPTHQGEKDELDKIHRGECMPLDTDSTSRTYSSDTTMCLNLEESARSLDLGSSIREKNSSIRFGTVQIRDYERIVSDNPAVRNGVPIG